MKPRKRKCKNCGEWIESPRSTLQVACSARCALAINKAKAEKKRREETRELKKQTRTAKEWIPKLQEQINKLIRYIDKGQACISNRSPWQDGLMDAGHYFPRSSHFSLRFHLLNIWAQSKYDNQYNEGNRQGARESFIDLFGEDVAQEIDQLPKMHPVSRWTAPELCEAYEVCLQLQKEAKSLPVLSQKARVEVRRKYNERLNLY